VTIVDSPATAVSKPQTLTTDEDKDMSKGYRRSLYFLFSLAALLMFSAGVYAQDCDECSPYTSHCNDYCERCTRYGQDGCANYVADTCGSFHNLEGECLANNCTPSWSETSRVTQGTYDGNSLFDCDHHSVQWVTVVDGNHCNEDSYFWTQSYCDNVSDGHKSGLSPDCCDGYGPDGQPNSLYTCDGNHYCTG